MEGISSYKEALLYLVILEFIISTIAIIIGHLKGNKYFQGVGVGLLISWVTGGLAYIIVNHRVSVNSNK